MLVKIEEIQEKGLEVTAPIKPVVLEEALKASADFSLVSATPLQVSFKKVSGQVHVTGGFDASLKAPCKRCLDDVELTVPVKFALRMVEHIERDDDDDEDDRKRPDDTDDEAQGTFDLDEVDAEPFNGKTIDLDPIVREQVLLALPVSVLCEDDCKGLCAKCGQNLNVKDCGHGREKEIDPRLAKLAEIKIKN